ncbi:hypothetical protein O0I10_001878 [Lichtheimia ornata]|uniref:Uncharacterized protein n=1 Tax=Lichtheimia ornata TaxID=688661 RepID=A0AAD7VB21_9FUNG|nr:uncharacterized protein O0I10_001878 [Lichtheimia ornata]KAJ8662185.1 hypothetical protein O0I10_001878 [Lichtheimia ornata]
MSSHISNDAYASAMATEYIRGLSFQKLQEIHNSNVDQSIHKLVLITNLLRMETQIHNQQDDDDMLEQQWLNTCLDELQEDEQQEDPMDTEPPIPDNRQQHHYQPHCMDERDDFREQPYWSVVAVQDTDMKELYYTFRNFHNACEHWLA